jgi:hypothetical protein
MDVIHECLEHCRRVRQAERHYEKLEESLMRAERCLLHIAGRHDDLVIAGAKVHLCKEFRPLQFVEQLVDDRNWILVLQRGGT